MRKTLSYAGVAIGALIIILLFVTSKSYTQLGVAIILYPIFSYITLKLLPRVEVYNINDVANENFATAKVVTHIAPPEEPDVLDAEKRSYLKLVGTAGLSFFIFSLLGRKAEDLIFDRPNRTSQLTSNQNNNTTTDIKPAMSDEYKISEVDDGIISYYGFINKNSNWMIMKVDTPNNSYRYAKGEDDFSKSWVERQNLTYDYYDNLFQN